jgi:hypothetical protein
MGGQLRWAHASLAACHLSRKGVVLILSMANKLMMMMAK